MITPLYCLEVGVMYLILLKISTQTYVELGINLLDTKIITYWEDFLDENVIITSMFSLELFIVHCWVSTSVMIYNYINCASDNHCSAGYSLFCILLDFPTWKHSYVCKT